MLDGKPFSLIRNALDASEISSLIEDCHARLQLENSIPSYLFIEHLDSPVVSKISQLIENSIGERIYYLNDFYIFTNAEFQSNWHMDTELFTFENALNVWILLSPESIESPLAALQGVNDREDNHYHKLVESDQSVKFLNLSNGNSLEVDSEFVQEHKVNAPDVHVGDVLLLNPRYFHRTNATVPKHVIVFKYLLESEQGFLSQNILPEIYWKEIRLFKKAVSESDNWPQTIETIKSYLDEPEGRKALAAGFYPENMQFYRDNLSKLHEARTQ